MKTTEKDLAEWATNDRDTGNDLHVYFEDTFGRWDWLEVYEEGVRIGNLMFDEEVEIESPRADIMAAVAAQSAQGAFAFVAACLGVDADDLMFAAMECSQDDMTPPIGAEALMARCSEKARERAAVVADKIL